MISPPTLRVEVRASGAIRLRSELGTGGTIRVYSGNQTLITLSAEVAKVVAQAVKRAEPPDEGALLKKSAAKASKPKAIKKLKAAKKPKKIKAAKPAIKVPPPPFHLARRPALSPSKTNLFRGSVSAP